MSELNVTAKSVSVCYHDANSHGKDSDAININLRLKGNKFDLLLEMMQNAIAAKVCLLPFPTAFHKLPLLMWFCNRWPWDQLLLLTKHCQYITSIQVLPIHEHCWCSTGLHIFNRVVLALPTLHAATWFQPSCTIHVGSALLMVPALECRQQRPSCMQWTGPNTAPRTQRSMVATLSLA